MSGMAREGLSADFASADASRSRAGRLNPVLRSHPFHAVQYASDAIARWSAIRGRKQSYDLIQPFAAPTGELASGPNNLTDQVAVTVCRQSRKIAVEHRSRPSLCMAGSLAALCIRSV